MSSGIRDKVAIVGMGCTHFGDRWDVGAEALARPGLVAPAAGVQGEEREEVGGQGEARLAHFGPGRAASFARETK